MKKPNIIYVLPDQFRRQSMSFWQKDYYKDAIRGVTDPVHTPNIDILAEEGLVLTQAISTCPLCSPYRAMLFSGRYPEQNGVKSNCNAKRTDSLHEELVCLTDVLANQGYNLGYLGKLHLDMPEPFFNAQGTYVGEEGKYYADGSKPEDLNAMSINNDSDRCCWDMMTPPGPKRHGMDYWYSYGTFDVHKNPHYWDTEGNKHEPKEWSPDHEAKKAASYILNNEQQRDPDKPYFLFVGMNPPHNPYSSLEDTNETMFHRFYSEEVVANTKDLLNRPNVPQDADAHEWVRYYFSSISGVDRAFGEIMDALEASGEKDNTIVIFSSDHGDMMGSHNAGAKNVPHEESFVIPYIIRYPKVLEKGLNDLMLSGVDVMPTLLGLAGLGSEIPSDVEGTDYSEILINGESDTVEKPSSALYIFDYPELQRKGVRTDRYTFVIERNESSEMKPFVLFDNEKDPYQMTNLSIQDLPKETQLFLRRELGYWLKEANDLWYQQRAFDDFIIYP